MESCRPLITYGTKRKLGSQEDYALKHRRVENQDYFQDARASPVPSDTTCATATPPSSPPARCRNHSIRPKPLVQMQLNIGARVQKSCKECGMTYTLSSTQDVALHKSFHEQSVRGMDFGRAGRRTLEARCEVVRPLHGLGVICVVDASCPLALRKKAAEALALAQLELGAVPIDELWSWSGFEKRSRYKLYLYMNGTRCTGVCLAEHITTANRTMQTETDVLVLDTIDHPAEIGISRIWVARGHRRHGIAVDMLAAVRQTFSDRGVVAKEGMAFSQPTESGRELARQWFGQPFLVYAGS